jgi:hypothetical protein
MTVRQAGVPLIPAWNAQTVRQSRAIALGRKLEKDQVKATIGDDQRFSSFLK